MVWCCPLSSMWSGPVGGGVSLMKLSTLAPNMRLSAHVRTTVVCISMYGSSAGAPLKWSDVMFAQMCGSKAKGPNPWYPSGGLGPPPTGKDGASCQSHHGWHNLKGPSWASRGSHMKMGVHLRYFCCFLQWKQQTYPSAKPVLCVDISTRG